MNQKSEEQKKIDAQNIIKTHVGLSLGAGFIPIPFADIVAVTAVQMDMIRQLSNLYGVEFKESQGKALVSALTSSSFARLGARAVKFIPGIGSALGGVTLSVLSGASTYAVGEVFKAHFSNGGTILDLDVDQLRKYYDEMFEKGKSYSRNIKKEVVKEDEPIEEVLIVEDEDEKPKVEDKMNRLTQLADMLDKGIISQKEFDLLKKELLG